MSSEKQEFPKIRVSSQGRDGGGVCTLTLNGLTKEELEEVLSSIQLGLKWIRLNVEDGRLLTEPVHNPLPGPTDDDEMLPFWRKKTSSNQSFLFDDFEMSKEKGFSPSITIQSLCGYNYSKENYKRVSENLEKWGFECLRSRRGSDGRFWEIWFLPGLWASKGDLRARVDRETKEENKLSKALEFLRVRSSFGTLDVSNQRLAMVLYD